MIVLMPICPTYMRLVYINLDIFQEVKSVNLFIHDHKDESSDYYVSKKTAHELFNAVNLEGPLGSKSEKEK